MNVRFLVIVKSDDMWERAFGIDFSQYGIETTGSELFAKAKDFFLLDECSMEMGEMEQFALSIQKAIGEENCFIIADGTDIRVDPFDYCICFCGKLIEKKTVHSEMFYKVKIDSVEEWCKAAKIKIEDDTIVFLNGFNSSLLEFARKKYSEMDNREEFIWEDLEDGTIALKKCLGNNPQIIVPDKVNGKTVTKIGQSAFNKGWYKTNLIESIIIPDSVTEIGDFAFMNCRNLKNVNIPKSLRVISKCMFYLCESLEEIVIPNSVELIDKEAFWGCGITRVIIPSSVKIVGLHAFEEAKVKEVIIEEGVEEIKTKCFLNCMCEITVYPRKLKIGKDVFSKKCKIIAYDDSTAMRYAKKNKIKTKTIKEKKESKK